MIIAQQENRRFTALKSGDNVAYAKAFYEAEIRKI
jgi:hypothetical protein